jgi:anti-sigma factor RsiW
MHKPSDEVLIAYLDGELDAARRAELEAVLEHDAETRERAARLTESAVQLRAAFDEVLREEVPERLLAAAHGAGAAAPSAEIVPFRARPARFNLAAYRRWWIAVPMAASLLGLVIGGGFGYFHFDEQPAADEKLAAAAQTATNNWLDNAAEYHKLFVSASAESSSFTDIPAKDGDGGEVMQKLSQRIGSQDGMRAIPNLKPWGLIFQGARLIVVDRARATQLVYTADNKTVGKAIGPLTVMIAATKRPDVAPTFDHRQDENLLYWRHKGHSYAIVGQADINYMWGLANDIAFQLGAI